MKSQNLYETWEEWHLLIINTWGSVWGYISLTTNVIFISWWCQSKADNYRRKIRIIQIRLFGYAITIRDDKHERFYKLQWLNEYGEVRITKQVLIFFVGKNKDEVLCNVVLMHIAHLLLSSPWKFHRKVKHNGLRTYIILKRMERLSHLYHCRLCRFMKTNWSWKRKVKQKI